MNNTARSVFDEWMTSWTPKQPVLWLSLSMAVILSMYLALDMTVVRGTMQPNEAQRVAKVVDILGLYLIARAFGLVALLDVLGGRVKRRFI